MNQPIFYTYISQIVLINLWFYFWQKYVCFALKRMHEQIYILFVKYIIYLKYIFFIILELKLIIKKFFVGWEKKRLIWQWIDEVYLEDLMVNMRSLSSVTASANSPSNMVGIMLKKEWTRGMDWEPAEFLLSIILCACVCVFLECFINYLYFLLLIYFINELLFFLI